MDFESHAGSWHNPYQDLHLLQMLPAMVVLKANTCMGHKILSRVDTNSSPVTRFCPCSSGKVIKGGGGGGGERGCDLPPLPDFFLLLPI